MQVAEIYLWKETQTEMLTGTEPHPGINGTLWIDVVRLTLGRTTKIIDDNSQPQDLSLICTSFRKRDAV